MGEFSHIRMQVAIREVKASPAFKIEHPELSMPAFVTNEPPDSFPHAIHEALDLKAAQMQLN